jgi:hypothetical protein
VDIYTTIMSLLNVVMTLATGMAADASTAVFGADFSFVSFSVQSATQCTSKTCPGSFYTAITTAWANIGYVTHSDVLRFLSTTHFGKWAVLLYIAAAITGLIGVATNSPMRNYTWFFIGPALFSFLVGTTMKVQGVNWVVANRAAEDMSEVWRNAEAGLANTRLVKDGLLKIKGKYGPQAQYDVAMPMVFLDELFSATANILIEWTGIGRQIDNGGGESNLSNKATSGNKDAWWLLANLKWSYVENITASTVRNPDVRDALVTFLASECGDIFKQGIDSGAYIAATQARGATPIETVFNGNESKDYMVMQDELGCGYMPTPRSLGRLFKEKPSADGSYKTGSFLNFSPRIKTKPRETGRGVSIVCSEYLWTLIQALRFEAGSAYYQMVRSAPDGFDEEGFVTTLLYGWDVREKLGEDTQEQHQKAFLKHLILAYILRNELIAAPQLTTVDQRYAPAEQARSYSEANIRAYGSKGKFIELYNAAVMMPYLQGILAYFLIMAYPIACMMVILPGHYKAFFTWVSFFAWIKLWDVGFAMVHVIERGVWAMIGNNSYMATTARTLIEVAGKAGGIGVENTVAPGNGGGFGVLNPAALAARAAIPKICSLGTGTIDATQCNGAGVDQGMKEAFELFDKLLIVSANLDLDLSNGWYIYIMSALYLAVPAVTGQLVLGAKAGSAGLIKDAFSGVGSDGAQAAKTGAQHQAVNAMTANANSLGQAASMKAMRQSGFAAQALGLKNDQLKHGLAAANLDNEARAHSGLAGQMAHNATDFDFARGKGEAMLPNMGQYALPGQGLGTAFANTKAGQAIGNRLGGALSKVDGAMSRVPAYGALKGAASFVAQNPYASSGGAGGAGGGAGGGSDSPIMGDYRYGGHAAALQMKQAAGIAGSRAAGFSQDAQWQQTALTKTADGKGAYAGTLSDYNNYDAQMASWEARNDFAAHASAMAGIAGMNAGSLAGGPKPSGDATAFAFEGALGKPAQDSVQYAGNGFLTDVQNSTDKGKAELGWGYVDQYRPTGILDVHGASMGARTNGDIYVAGSVAGAANAGAAVVNAVSNPIETAVTSGKNLLQGSSSKQVDDVMKIKAPEPTK